MAAARRLGWMVAMLAAALTHAVAVAQPNDAAGAAADARCVRCHGGENSPAAALASTRHGAAARGAGLTCASCHGDSDAHVNKPAGARVRAKPDRVFGTRDERTAADRAGACLACHGSNRHLAFWRAGRHAEVACDGCHVVHDARHRQLRANEAKIAPFGTATRQLDYETCVSCHKQVRAQLTRTSHHPIVEGKVQCGSCHNPHGSAARAMLKDEPVNALCTGCHADKRGPFMFEHAPVEENCLSCHQPHGSNHAKLLSERVPNLCQDCHDWSRHPGAYYSGNQGFAAASPSNRLVARACLNCHTSIHGTNAPANRGRFFVR